MLDTSSRKQHPENLAAAGGAASLELWRWTSADSGPRSKLESPVPDNLEDQIIVESLWVKHIRHSFKCIAELSKQAEEIENRELSTVST